MHRIPEPELMDEPAQARAYAEADFAAVNEAFVGRFVSHFPDLERGAVLDLGCGPADIPIRLSRRRPGLRVVGVDGSAAMLALAREAIERQRPANVVNVVRAYVPDLPFPDQSFDAVISNSLLHHLAEPAPFWREIERVAKPGAPLLIMDLFRPDSTEQAHALVEVGAAGEPEILKRDFYNSLLAAFTPEEVRDQLRGKLPQLECRIVSERHWLAWGRR
jgi:ubiquinone/menaquinone biosynthesis C-methylase UbiE